MMKPSALLQIEDAESDAALVLRRVANAGCQVRAEQVETGSQMRAALGTSVCDAIVADYHRPQFDVVSGGAGKRGIRVADAGFQDAAVQRRFSRIEACGWLPKPYTPEQLPVEVLPAVSQSRKAI